jgi:integrase
VVTLYDVATRKRKDYTLGPYCPDGAPAAYDAVVSEWLARGRRLNDQGSSAPPCDISMNEALERFFLDVQRRCRRPDGSATGTAADVKVTVDYLSRMFGELPLSEFGADQLEALRDRLIGDGRVTPQINKRLSHSRQFYRWCLGRNLMPSTVNVWLVLEQMRQRARAVSPGEYGAKPGKIVTPADPAAFNKALTVMSPVAKAVAQLLRLTGARPSEILNARPCELNRSGDVWTLTPTWHKTAKKSKRPRVIYLGDQAKAVLSPWLLGCAPEEFIFTSAKSESKRLRERTMTRQTPRWPSHMVRNNSKRVGTKRRRSPSDSPFNPHALYVAIKRACRMAGVRPFSPYSLRHLRATELRESHGLEVARAVLGHSFASMSDHYSRLGDAALASKAAAEVG